MNKPHHYFLNKLFLVLLLIGLLLLLVLFTDPNRVILPVLIAPFLLIGGIIYQISHLFLRMKKSLHPSYVDKLLPLSIAGLGVALLLLRSLHQLTLKDSLLVCGFAAIFWLYIWRADFLHK